MEVWKFQVICFWFNFTSCFLSSLVLAVFISDVENKAPSTDIHVNHMICSISMQRLHTKKKTRENQLSLDSIKTNKTIIHPTFGSRWYYALKWWLGDVWKGFCFLFRVKCDQTCGNQETRLGNWQFKFTPDPSDYKTNTLWRALCVWVLYFLSQERIH